MDLQSVWIKMFPLLQAFNNEQRETIKSAVFASLGNCEISEINVSTDIVVSEEKTKEQFLCFLLQKRLKDFPIKP